MYEVNFMTLLHYCFGIAWWLFYALFQEGSYYRHANGLPRFVPEALPQLVTQGVKGLLFK